MKKLPLNRPTIGLIDQQVSSQKQVLRKSYVLDVQQIHPVIRIAHKSDELVRYPREIFDFCLVYFPRTSGTFFVDEVPYSFNPSTILLTPPFRASRFELPEGASTSHTAIHFDLNESLHGKEKLSLRSPYRVELSSSLEIPIATNLPKKHRVLGLLDELISARQRGDGLNDLRANYLLGQVLVEMWLNDEPEVEQGDFSTRVRDAAGQALLIIEREFIEPLSPSIIAQKVGLSAKYLARAFRNESGYSLMSYLNLVRVRKAIRLLKNQELSVKEVSARVGFNSPRYFSRVFLEHTQMTPSLWRQQMRGSLEEEKELP